MSGETAIGQLPCRPGKAVLSPADSLPAPAEELPPEVAKNLIRGTSTLGMGVLIERSCGFLANILAARFGGTQTFGAYALAISTANSVSTYAAGGIGSTAIRFSGEYAIGTPGYTALAQALALVAAVSATLAACTLWLGAIPLAHLLHKPELVPLLRWAGCSAAAIILLECCRGFFVGQKRLKALLCLSGFAGLGMLFTLPVASLFSPTVMLMNQSLIAIGAVLLCFLFYRKLQLASPHAGSHVVPVRSLLLRIWAFSVMQIGGIVSMNIAGWWLTTLIAKGDTTMAQMGFFAVAHQMRNMVALAPSLLIEGSFSEMTEIEGGPTSKSPDQVTAVCTCVSVLVALALAGFGMIVAPWALSLVYGKTYEGAAAAACIALATAVIHMGSGAASSRVSILSIKASAVINTTWAVVVGAAATLFLLHGADAARGAEIYFGAHLVSAALFLGFLKAKGHSPKGMLPIFTIGAGCTLALTILSVLRSTGTLPAMMTSLMVCIWVVALAGLVQLGSRERCLPSRLVLQTLAQRLLLRLNPGRSRSVSPRPDQE